jgi:hypothetical protein
MLRHKVGGFQRSGFRCTSLKPLLLALLSAALSAQSKPVPSVPCTTKACQSFNELARGHDSAVLQADMACFYDGDNPANVESEGNRTADEFFLTMDGKKAVTRRGEHPGIFVSLVLNGQPEDYHGYGGRDPKHGGLEDADSIKGASLFDDKKAGMADTYDDLGDAVRFAQLWFNRLTTFNDNKLVTSEEVLLQTYHEVVIRKSTKRFTEKMMDFRPGLLGTPDQNKEYHGRCYAVKR